MSADSVMSWALQTGLGITLLTAFILMIRRPFAQRFGATAAYILWALPVVRLFIPNITLPVLPPKLPEMTARLDYPRLDYMGVDMIPILTEAARNAPTPEVNPAVMLTALWLLGAAVWLCWQAARQKHYTQYLRLNSRPIMGQNTGLHNARPAWAAKTLGLARLPQIRLSNDNEGPLVTGILRPMIILPSNFETHFTPEQQRLAILHEMAHIRRKDLWAAGAALIFRALNWPNPLIHYAAQKFRADQEAACDVTVLTLTQTPTSVYAETLIRAAQSARRPAFAAPLGLTIYHPLKERLMMMKTQETRSTLLSRAAAVALIFGAVAFTAPLTIADSPDEPKLAGEAEVKNVYKKTYRWKENSDDGETSVKHFELTTKDGVTTAYSIDENGVKTAIDPNIAELAHGTHISIHEAQRMRHHSEPGQNTKVIVKRMKGAGSGSHGTQVYKYAMSDDFEFDFDFEGDMPSMKQSYQAEIMVETASGLLDGVKTDELSSKTQRKIEKARKALKEAQEAIDADK